MSKKQFVGPPGLRATGNGSTLKTQLSTTSLCSSESVSVYSLFIAARVRMKLHEKF
uniref:Uncharacterized protein n=1 Tax=Anguilla anguilla TaxID=7936 RepID=A0A0E9QK27_ANGAN